MTLALPHTMSPQPSSAGGQGTVRGPAGPATVTGVLVVHDGATWLTECLDALVLQTRPPDRLVIIDTGSIDDSLQIATVMSATGSFDHRAIDGADGARLMQAFKRLVEAPLGMLA